MALLALGVVAVPSLRANATVHAVTLTGSGTISPGLTPSGYPGQTFTFGGTGVVVGDAIQSTINCVWAGDDTIGSINQGAGRFAGSCADLYSDSNYDDGSWVSISGSYTRTGEVMTISATATGGGLDGAWGGVCEWAPTSLDTNSLRLNSFFDSCNYTIEPTTVGG
ncbi:MAG: hypothetical protein JO074_00035, partial [Frankiales bacterium]|nr:hypothetical protein [Frankiales bacterium]